MRKVRWTLLAALAAPLWAADPTADLYVSPQGNDAWSGALAEPNPAGTDGPLATIDAARRRVRRLLADPTARGPVTVLLRGGVYPLSGPICFSPEDSGRPERPVVYAAYPGERPVLSGGRRITGWRREGELWVADLPAVRAGEWWFGQLFVDGERRPRARTPNDGYLYVAGYGADAVGPGREREAFVYQPGDLEPWSDLDQATVVVYHSWETSLLRVKSLDHEKRVVEFTGRANWPFGYWGPGQRYVVENVRAALDAPGEWQLYAKAGVLRYFPLPGEDPDRTEVVAPTTLELISFRGDMAAGLPVSDITLRGLSLHYADWWLEPSGHSDPQAVCTLPAAVMMSGAVGCALEDCTLAHVGRYGVWIREGCRDCRIERCHLYDLGAGGVRIGETYLPADPGVACEGHVVDNCFIHGFGKVYAAGVGVYIAQASDCRVTHNEVCDGYYSGMSIGWNWGTSPTAAHRNRIEYNHIHHVLQGVLSDGGGIYTLGTSPGTVIRGNVIHDVYSYPQPTIAWGIYLDAESNRITVENNLCYDVQNGGLMMHNGAHANVVRNNIFARAAQQLIWRSPSSITEPNIFERNICYVTAGDLFLYDGKPDELSTWDHNLYWRMDGQELLFMDDSLAEWRERGLDLHSLIADPRFVDPAGGDFRLHPDSPPIRELGFQPFDPADAGLYGDPAWVALPRQLAFAPTVMPPAPPPRPTRIAEDFEAVAVGQQPPVARCLLGPLPGAAIRVTDARAANGRRSLEVVDAANLKNIWDPHLFYDLVFRRGTVKVAFQLYYEPGALPWVELRSPGYPYQVGPSIKIDEQGRLVANGRELGELPSGRWIGFELRCALGATATGSYSLTVTVPGEAARVYSDLPCDPQFRRLGWTGFISLADRRTVFGIDDLVIEAAQ